jgi:F-type H+-transporting ATPase subunit delta
MAEHLTLARPYAEAVFALARDSGSLESWMRALQGMASVVMDATARECIANPKVSQVDASRLIIESVGIALTAEQQNLVRVLVANQRAVVLPEIYDLFVLLKNAHDGVRDAKVTSAYPLDQAALGRLQSDLETRFGTKLRLDVDVDPALIGGVRIALGDEVIDASVRGKLAAMAAALQN